MDGQSKDVKGTRVTGTRERVEQTIILRKQKRMEQLRKRRNNRQSAEEAKANQALPSAPQNGAPFLPGAENSGGAALGMPGAKIELRHLNNYVEGVMRGSEDVKLDCTRKIRKLLSKEEDPPALDIINAGLVPRLVEFLKAVHNPKLQFEAAWALTNIASTEHTQYITQDNPPKMRNAVPFLAQLMKSQNPDVREQSCWCLGNVAGDGSKLRDIVLNTPGCLHNLILNITRAHSESMLKNATWALSNFCRGKPQPSIQVIAPALHILGGLIKCVNDEVLRDACWAFSYISDGEDDRIQAVLNVNPVPRLVQLLGHNKSAVVTPALRSLGNIISGNDDQTQHALDNGAMPALLPLLSHDKVNIQKEACWTLSNIAAGTPQQARTLVTATDAMGHPVIAKIIALANGGHYDVRKEAAWVIANICTGGDEQNIRALVDSKPTSAIYALCNLLSMHTDLRMLLVGLEALEAILSRGVPHPGQSYEQMIDDMGGLSHLERLIDIDDKDIFQKAVHIIQTYFTDEDDDDDDDTDDDDDDAFRPQ